MKMQKKWDRGAGVGSGGGWGVRVDVNEELIFLVKIKKKKIFFFGGGGGIFVKMQKKNWGGGGRAGGGGMGVLVGGVRVDVNEELKFL